MRFSLTCFIMKYLLQVYAIGLLGLAKVLKEMQYGLTT